MNPMTQYSDLSLDRASIQRRDIGWLQEQANSAHLQVLPVMGSKNAITYEAGAPKALVLRGAQALQFMKNSQENILLGVKGKQPVFACVQGENPEAELENLVPQGEFTNLRSVQSALPPQDAALLALAKGMAYWHSQNQYCGRCGSSTQSASGGHMRKCPQCTRELYPRIAPAVIMLCIRPGVSGQPDRCLLGRHAHSPAGHFSTLAGFVDVGESFENTVRREVMEEAGVKVSDVRYYASQPWPFPSSLMVGFYATAISESIKVDPEEIAEARWFSAQQLLNPGKWGEDGTNQICLPPHDSIAHVLITNWVQQELNASSQKS